MASQRVRCTTRTNESDLDPMGMALLVRIGIPCSPCLVCRQNGKGEEEPWGMRPGLPLEPPLLEDVIGTW